MPTHIRYGFLLALISLMLLTLCLVYPILSVFWVWMAVDFGTVSFAYFTQNSNPFKKSADGKISAFIKLVNGPFLLITWVIWRLHILVSSEDGCNEIAPGLWLGRRPLKGEVPEGARWLVDLTAEFERPGWLPTDLKYTCLPTLDHTPLPSRSTALAKEIAAFDGCVLIFCAEGHGRSVSLMTRALIAKGVCPDAKSALKLVRRGRPLVRLTPEQWTSIDST
ncbi:MAG: hypothetical protein ABJA67_09490 [Chthonomonadales bacterium]